MMEQQRAPHGARRWLWRGLTALAVLVLLAVAAVWAWRWFGPPQKDPLAPIEIYRDESAPQYS
jgi:predicted negative regulator of RcsB-dependent stress response